MKILVLFFSVFVLAFGHAQVSDFNAIDFSRADNRAALFGGRQLDNLSVLVHDLTSNLSTDVEKFRAIYMWVCHNIDGDIRQNNITSRKRNKFKNDHEAYLEWNASYKRKAFKTLLKHKKTMCTGYAYLIKELCFLANIEAVIVDGYGRTIHSNVEGLDVINHSWNVVKLNNKWYVCDATWSSGYMVNDALFVADYNDGYFLTDPILFAKNHYPIQKKWFLNDSLAQTEFVVSPLVYGETFEQQIIPLSPENLVIETDTNTQVDFSFKTLNKTATAHIELIKYSGTTEKSFEILELEREHEFTSFKCQFEHKGTYDVHLKINDAIVASYTVNVNKV